MSRRILTLALAAFALVLAPAFAGDETFVRLEKDGNDAALQTAYATYRLPGSDVEVVLYGVVHIADQAYYNRVQTDLDACDIVLYEGVAPSDPEAGPSEDMQSLGELQESMGELLGLTFQKDGIDYTRANLVHADMTFDEFQKALGSDGGSLSPFGNFIDEKTLKALMPIIKMATTFGKQLMKSNPQMQDSLKLQMAGQLSSVQDLSAQLGEKMSRVILQDRNEVTMKVLHEQLPRLEKGRIAIFYGAAHMPDFEERLAALGYERVEKRWVSAWQIGGGIESDTPSTENTRPRITPAPAARTQKEEKVWY